MPFHIPQHLLRTSALWLLLSGTAFSQITPDRTLSNRSSVPRNCTDCEITGGTRAGNNLFHSFRQFSVRTGGRAYFNHAANVRNIFARVTGSAPSSIDGILQTNGAANLFLLNPNGILFGPNASLNLGGSFFATTADQITFADRTQFSAVAPQTSPLLTLSTPVGLQFGQNPGAVTNRSGLEVAPGQTLAFWGNGVFLDNGSLTARSGRIELGSLAPATLASLTDNGSSYGIDYTNNNLNQNFSDIDISNRSLIDTSGIDSTTVNRNRNGGAVQLQGRTIRVAAESAIISRTYAGTGASQQFNATQELLLDSASVGTLMQGQTSGQAGNIVVRAEALILRTGSNRSFLASQTFRGSSGNAGNLSIGAGEIVVQDGSRLETATFGRGRGGDLSIRAATIEVRGFYPEARNFDSDPELEQRGQVTSAISSQAERVSEGGDAGNLTIQAERLVVRAGGAISTATFAGGNGGNLSINATEIQLQGVSPAATPSQYRSGIFVSAEPEATGRVGELRLTTDRLTLEDRAQISARNRGVGSPGRAILNVDTLTVEGGSEISASTEQTGRGGTLILNADRVRVAGSGQLGEEILPSSLSALSTAEASGQSGDLQIHTSTFRVSNNAVISVSGEGTGAAGNLIVHSGLILLEQGTLEAATQVGGGASIRLENVDLLMLRDQSLISARAFNNANGGNVTIQATNGYLVAEVNRNSDVIANAKQGSGGEITIDTSGIFGLAEGRSNPPNSTNDLDASSEQGPQGIVGINQPNIDPTQGLIELPSTVVDASQLIAQTCPTDSTTANLDDPSEFVITGRGGLPPTPTDPRDDALLTDWATLDRPERTDTPFAQSNRPMEHQATEHQATAAIPNQPETLVEAQGWVRNARGEVTLVAQVPAPFPAAAFVPLNCN